MNLISFGGPYPPAVVATLAALGLLVSSASAQPVLYVANAGNNTVGEYNTVTGATVNASLVNGQGLNVPIGLAMDNSNHLFVTNGGGNTIGQYNATTGATINAAFVNGQGMSGPVGLALDANNHLFPVSTTVGEYNATTGATINAAFISGPQLGIPVDAALDGQNHMFVTNNPGGMVGEYNATTGATINSSFVAGLNKPAGMALDTLGHLFVTEITNVVAECDAVTGAVINPNFITGLNDPTFLALDNNNHLFVSNGNSNTIGEYDATTGATINAALISQGLNSPDGLVFAASVPEPGSLALVSFAAASTAGWVVRRWRRRCSPHGPRLPNQVQRRRHRRPIGFGRFPRCRKQQRGQPGLCVVPGRRR